ncbi:MAG: hypothetical protein H6767_02770 [Candidatus Peribacteria bacterium]|nr:MAG: hypothetical protein H6767_02770 [Candidatus Peribacteria bacterium]
MKQKKSIASFIREEDGKTIKKSLLISSLGLVLGFSLSGVSADHSNYNNHSSGTGNSNHSSTHSSHNSHSSY